MAYLVGIAAIFGFAIGLRFKTKVLFTVLVFIFLATILMVLKEDMYFGEAVFAIFGVQLVCQIAYFLGTVARHCLENSGRTRFLL